MNATPGPPCIILDPERPVCSGPLQTAPMLDWLGLAFIIAGVIILYWRKRK